MLHIPGSGFEWGTDRGGAGLNILCAAGDAGAAMVGAFAGDSGGFGVMLFGHGEVVGGGRGCCICMCMY